MRNPHEQMWPQDKRSRNLAVILHVYTLYTFQCWAVVEQPYQHRFCTWLLTRVSVGTYVAWCCALFVCIYMIHLQQGKFETKANSITNIITVELWAPYQHTIYYYQLELLVCWLLYYWHFFIKLRGKISKNPNKLLTAIKFY